MSRTTKATLVFLILFFALVIARSVMVPKIECEVCITFGGGTQCRTASSETLDAARQSAVTAACATLAGGMTESIRCQNTPPDRVTCSD